MTLCSDNRAGRRWKLPVRIHSRQKGDLAWMTNGMPVGPINILRVTLDEIEKVSGELSLPRAEALLYEFEHDIREAFVRQDLVGVMSNCGGVYPPVSSSQRRKEMTIR
jgi:hypothetical protein